MKPIPNSRRRHASLREWRGIYILTVLRSLVPRRNSRHRAALPIRLDYTDLPMANDLLRDARTCGSSLQDGYAHPCRRFQDTDPLQCEILFYLAGDRPAKSGGADSDCARGAFQSATPSSRSTGSAARMFGIQHCQGVGSKKRRNLTLSPITGQSTRSALLWIPPSRCLPVATERGGFVPMATVEQDASSFCGVRSL